MQAQLSALDDQFQAKLVAEQERYDELLREKEALNDQWDEQNKQLLARHEQLLEEVTADCNAKVQVRWPCDSSQAILGSSDASTRTSPWPPYKKMCAI